MSVARADPAPAAALRPLEAEAVAYAHLPPGERYLHRTRDRALLALLRRHGIGALGDLRIVELGCGAGALLASLLGYGARPERLVAVDVDTARAAQASRQDARVVAADMASLPYRDGAFDLAFAFTAFSSVVDEGTRRRAAAEALRVLRPGGLLVVYDFWVNPLNRRVCPLTEGQLRALVAPLPLELERVTLAPPLARLLRGRPALCRPLERLPWLRTHLLAAVVKESER